jgi:hypothetical protein
MPMRSQACGARWPTVPNFTAAAWLAAVLALTGNGAEARDALKRYFLIRGTMTRTIGQ